MSYVKKILFGSKVNELLETGIDQLDDENYFAAIKVFTEALEINNKNEFALFSRAKAYLEVSCYEKAISDLENLNLINPSYSPELYHLLASANQHVNISVKANEYADKYLAEHNDSVKAMYFTARIKYLNKEYNEALKITDLMLANSHENFNVRYLRSLILFGLDSLVSSHNEINKAIEFDSINDYALNLRGLINVQLLNYKEAMDDFDYAIRLNPVNAIYYFNFAKLKLKVGDLFEAQKYINSAIELDEENKPYYLFKAHLDLLAEDYIAALDSYSNALNLDSSDQEIIQKVIDLNIYLDNYKAAKNYLAQIIKLNQNNPEHHFKLARIEFHLGNNNEAISNIEKVISLNSNNTKAILQKGVLEYWEGKYQDAINTFESLQNFESYFDVATKYKIRALIKSGEYNLAQNEILKMNTDDRDVEFSVLNSHLAYLDDGLDDASSQINVLLKNSKFKTPAKLINGIIKTKQNKIEEIHELNIEDIDAEFNQTAQIFNAIVCVSKGHLNTAKYKFSNIPDLSSSQKNHIQAYLDFSE